MYPKVGSSKQLGHWVLPGVPEWSLTLQALRFQPERLMWFRQCEFLGAVRLLLLPSCEIVAPSVLEVAARLQVVACEMRRGDRRTEDRRTQERSHA